MRRTGMRAVAILIKGDEILLIHRFQNGREFWVFPGGGKEENETTEEAVIREVEEEASIKCKIEKLLYTHKYSDIDHSHYFYLCKYISGTPKLGNFNEVETMKKEDEFYEPIWVSLKKIPKLLLYPLEIRDWLIEDVKNSFRNTPKTAVLSTKEIRQEI